MGNKFMRCIFCGEVTDITQNSDWSLPMKLVSIMCEHCNGYIIINEDWFTKIKNVEFDKD